MSAEAVEKKGPLAGIRVVEFKGLGPGPHAATLLADLGADVVIVQRPGEIPPAGHRDPIQRNRRVVEANLKDPADIEKVLGLLERADELNEGIRPRVAGRLGDGRRCGEACRGRRARGRGEPLRRDVLRGGDRREEPREPGVRRGVRRRARALGRAHERGDDVVRRRGAGGGRARRVRARPRGPGVGRRPVRARGGGTGPRGVGSGLARDVVLGLRGVLEAGVVDPAERVDVLLGERGGLAEHRERGRVGHAGRDVRHQRGDRERVVDGPGAEHLDRVGGGLRGRRRVQPDAAPGRQDARREHRDDREQTAGTGRGTGPPGSGGGVGRGRVGSHRGR
ncbi:CoA transferase [Cellulosimicrobium funkei]